MALQRTTQILVVLCITLMCHETVARASYTPWLARQERPHLIGEVDNSDESYPDTRKVQEVDLDSNARWLWLKDLLLSENEDNRVVRKNVMKEHVQKKSNLAWGEYMTPCHFKICNFGRKRNVFTL